jgi:dihydrofolate synthase / folylpolyglutamate synthase
MNLAAWLSRLENFPSGLHNNSLDTVKSIARKLDLLNFPGKIIIVGGTNGKGSCVVMLEAILHAAGYQTGAFISPHVLRYNERIRYNTEEIDDESICSAFSLINNNLAGNILSYFEFSTLAALAIFKKLKIDILILEVGLGGRYDAVNILDADIAIITTISLEHTKILGDTREAIGYEKAGIMRSNRPVICGDPNIPNSIYDFARNIGAKLYVVNKDFSYEPQDNSWDWQGKKCLKKLPIPKLPMANAATALMAIELLRQDLKIAKKDIMVGLKQAFLLGRLQKVNILHKEIIFDVAHNPESVALLAKNLKSYIAGEKRILAVVSMLKDKDIVSSLQEITPIIAKWYVGKIPGENIRAASNEELVACLLKAGGKNYIVLDNITIALQQAFAEYRIKDTIVVFGSFYAVAECLMIVKNYKDYC